MVQKKLKELGIMYENAFYIWFLDIAKFVDLRWKSADVSRTQGMCHVIHLFFRFSLSKV